jgi:hypothetical protein
VRNVEMGDRTRITTPYMNLNEAAVYCGCSTDVLAAAMAERRVGYIRLTPQAIVFSCDELDAFMHDHEIETWHNYVDGHEPDDEPPSDTPA